MVLYYLASRHFRDKNILYLQKEPRQRDHQDCPPGSIRFNTDSAHLEYWNGLSWLEFEASSEELGDQKWCNTNSLLVEQELVVCLWVEVHLAGEIP